MTVTAPSRTWPMTQSPPWRTAASMASASSPVGVLLCETSSAAGSIPAPTKASVTWAVAGFGAAAANLPSASATDWRTVSVAPAPAPSVVGGAEDAVEAAAVPCPAPAVADCEAGSPSLEGSADVVPPTQPDKMATRAAQATAAGTAWRTPDPIGPVRSAPRYGKADNPSIGSPVPWSCR